MSNVFDLKGQPYEPGAPEASPAPLVVRVVVDQPVPPTLTGFGVLVAVVCAVVSFLVVSAALGGLH